VYGSAHIIITVFDNAPAGGFYPAAKTADARLYRTVIGNDFPSCVFLTDPVPFFFIQIMYQQIHSFILRGKSIIGKCVIN